MHDDILDKILQNFNVREYRTNMQLLFGKISLSGSLKAHYRQIR
jgi:hypothetical protein